MSLGASIGQLGRSAVRLLVRLYYPTVEITGRERIPASGTVLFCANHPNSMLDPAIVGLVAGRPVHFFAKAPLFDVPVFGAVMRALGMVPAYRGADDRSQVRQNLASLEAGAAWLARGEAVGIFPEGKSHDLARVEQVRTGAARLALQAVQSGAAVTLVPLGLNYERKERFRSAVWVNIGEPLDANAALRDHTGDDRKAMRHLTAQLDRHLKQATVHLDEEKWAPFLADLEMLMPPPDGSGPIERIRQRKRIADAMNYFLAADRPRTESVAAAIEEHRWHLAAAGLDLRSELSRQRGAAWWARAAGKTLGLAVGFVPALAGLLHHLVPFVLTRLAGRLFRQPLRATIALSRLGPGLVIYAAWYALAWSWLARRFPDWVAWTWTTLMPLAGILALHYWPRTGQAARVLWQRIRMSRRRGELDGLRVERAAVSERLRAMAQDFAAAGTESPHEP